MKILHFKVFINLSAITDLPSLCEEYTKISSLSSLSCIKLLQNSLPWSTHNLLSLRLDSFTISINTLRTVLSFKGLTHVYVVKTSMTLNKYLTTFLLFEKKDFISAKPAAQILSSSLVYTLYELFLVTTGLWTLRLVPHLHLFPIFPIISHFSCFFL